MKASLLAKTGMILVFYSGTIEIDKKGMGKIEAYRDIDWGYERIVSIGESGGAKIKIEKIFGVFPELEGVLIIKSKKEPEITGSIKGKLMKGIFPDIFNEPLIERTFYLIKDIIASPYQADTELFGVAKSFPLEKRKIYINDAIIIEHDSIKGNRNIITNTADIYIVSSRVENLIFISQGNIFITDSHIKNCVLYGEKITIDENSVCEAGIYGKNVKIRGLLFPHSFVLVYGNNAKLVLKGEARKSTFIGYASVDLGIEKLPVIEISPEGALEGIIAIKGIADIKGKVKGKVVCYLLQENKMEGMIEEVPLEKYVSPIYLKGKRKEVE